MKTYILVDSLNMFFRAKHVGGGKDIDMRVGMAMHIMFNSVKKVWREFSGDHVVFCLEGRSWRKDFYPPYKANRKVKMDQLFYWFYFCFYFFKWRRICFTFSLLFNTICLLFILLFEIPKKNRSTKFSYAY